MNKIMKQYVDLVNNSNQSQPLCIFLDDNEYDDLLTNFRIYLIEEKILKSPYDSVMSKVRYIKSYGCNWCAANTLRFMILEDFLNKHYNK